jgi:hypothetical protein
MEQSTAAVQNLKPQRENLRSAPSSPVRSSRDGSAGFNGMIVTNVRHGDPANSARQVSAVRGARLAKALAMTMHRRVVC